MSCYLHAYIRDTATGKENPLDAKDLRTTVNVERSGAARAAGDTRVSTKAIRHGLSKAVIKTKIKNILENFLLPPAPAKESKLNQEISDLRKWKALLEAEDKGEAGRKKAYDKLNPLTSKQKKANRKKGPKSKSKIEEKFIVSDSLFLKDILYDNISKEIDDRKAQITAVETALLISFIPFENGEVCFIHRGGRAGRLPKDKQWLRSKKIEKSRIDKMDGDIGVKRRKVVAWDLLCHLDDFLGEVSYKVTSDPAGKQPIKAIAPIAEPAAAGHKTPLSGTGASATVPTGTGAKEESKDALSNLKRVSILRRKADYLQDVAMKSEAEKTFSATSLKGWSGVFKYFEIESSSPFCKSEKAGDIPGDITHFFEKRPNGDIHSVENIPAVWIPNEFPGYFHEDPRGVTYIEKDGSSWRQKDFLTEKGKPDSCVYAIVDDDLSSYLYIAQAATSPGGGGGMRSDNPWDAEYQWFPKNNNARLLGFSLGLSDKQRIINGTGEPTEKEYFEAPLPIARESKTATRSTMDSEIRYWKKFPESPVGGKKNKPRESKPLQREETKIDRKDVKKLYTKKQKGGWTNGRKDERPIKGAIDDRDSAGGVMRDALKTVGIFPEVSLSSATAFAEMVVSTGKTAKDWFDFSAPVAPFKKAGATQDAVLEETKKLKETLRTDQEWCHLVGHGDGGEEFFENFISGSKHCNTEQLAIETGQRTGRVTYGAGDANNPKLIDLAVKVTGYVFSQDTVNVKRNAFSEVEGKLLKSYKLFKGSVSETLSGIDTLLKAYNTYKEALKKPGGSAAPVPRDPVQEVLSKDSQPSSEDWKKAEIRRQPAAGSKDAEKHNVVSESVIETLTGIAALPLPLGKFVRYKVFIKDEKTYRKIFDHTFEAQKESFDFFEYKIIESTVRRTIAAAAGREDAYRTAIKLKAERLGLPAEKAAADG